MSNFIEMLVEWFFEPKKEEDETFKGLLKIIVKLIIFFAMLSVLIWLLIKYFR